MKKDYNSSAQQLVDIIDIALDCFQSFPPENFNITHVNQFVKTYIDYKEKVINPEPKFRNIKSLNYLVNDTLIYFQESTGRTVEEFWKKIQSNQIDIKRENKFEKILKRGKIKNNIEYDTIIDLYNHYLESKIPSKEEINRVNDMITQFENRRSKR